MVTDSDRVNLVAVHESLDLLTTKVRDLENVPIPVRAAGRIGTQQAAEVTRQLLYLQHLCRRVENAIMDEYWHTRGQDDHYLPERGHDDRSR